MCVNPRASSQVETGMSGNFLSCSKGVKALWKFQGLDVISLEKPQRKRASSRLEGKTSWIFSSCDIEAALKMFSFFFLSFLEFVDCAYSNENGFHVNL